MMLKVLIKKTTTLSNGGSLLASQLLRISAQAHLPNYSHRLFTTNPTNEGTQAETPVEAAPKKQNEGGEAKVS